jgi:hypothetical protein
LLIQLHGIAGLLRGFLDFLQRRLELQQLLAVLLRIQFGHDDDPAFGCRTRVHSVPPAGPPAGGLREGAARDNLTTP